ncbi:hypothetical protein NLX83_39610 [Allokutzneria sp. A3M-2-11 16]|uniref:hypothetical protein n=1 Tax=Allokutzneria sp. A3M-2-11 16 TaxID=2962043 RepID=UPI0020B88251|nr:hypothetical protein [Allokutzneria sp. A3M-2-11 16]MCP3805392.1 hypothetical protein [Allokutzneria sp. A3M-2-11 16]
MYELEDTRYYGYRYVDTAELDLYGVAGRILSDLKADQATGTVAQAIVFVLKVVGNRISVLAHLLPAEMSGEYANSEHTRARIKTVTARYNWQGKDNKHDVRFLAEIKVAKVRADRHDGLDIGALVG